VHITNHVDCSEFLNFGKVFNLQSGIITYPFEPEVLNPLNKMNIPYLEKSVIVHGKIEHKFCRKDNKTLLKHALSGKINCGTQVQKNLKNSMVKKVVE
jgi:hypothetical protein